VHLRTFFLHFYLHEVFVVLAQVSVSVLVVQSFLQILYLLLQIAVFMVQLLHLGLLFLEAEYFFLLP